MLEYSQRHMPCAMTYSRMQFTFSSRTFYVFLLTTTLNGIISSSSECIDQSCNIAEGEAVVFSYHSFSGSLSIEESKKLYVSVVSFREHHRDLTTYFFTNLDINELDPIVANSFTKIVYMNLMELSGLSKVYKDLSLDKSIKKLHRIACATKIQAILTGWDKNILPRRVLYLDCDIVVLIKNSLYAMFEPLDYYDIAGVFEGYAVGPRPTPAVGGGYEMNTGVFSVRAQAYGLLQSWLHNFKLDVKHYLQYSSIDQQALMVTLQYNKNYRVLPMPPMFNIRRPVLFPLNGPDLPVVVHTHAFGEKEVELDKFRLYVGNIVRKIFLDCYQHINKGLHHLETVVKRGTSASSSSSTPTMS